MDEHAKLFLQYNYTETKDLCKHFLTVVSAILVFSLTFSEKIINFHQASRSAKMLLLIAWVLLIGSIVACGLGLVFISLAGGQAVYGAKSNYQPLALTSYKWIIAAGLAFVVGLVFLIITAVVSIYSKPGAVNSDSHVVSRDLSQQSTIDSDSRVEAAIKEALAAEGDVMPLNIDVKVEGGVATLLGVVDTEEQKVYAERHVRDVAGVRNVVNLIDVGDPSAR
jgi:BON domain